MSPLSARRILLLVTGVFLLHSPLRAYEPYCEPEITHIYLSEYSDSSGNIYLQGLILGEADMDPGEGVHILSEHGGRSFLLKLDREENFIWVRQLDADISDMVLDQSGNLLITGNFQGELDFDPGEGSHLLSSDSDAMYILSLDRSGSFKDVRMIEHAYSSHICLDDTGNVYISGGFWENADFDPGVHTRILFSEHGGNYILMLHQDMELGWVSQFDTYIYSMLPDKSGNLHFNGSFNGEVIGKLDNSGNLLWEKTMQETDAEGSISISNSGTVTLTGEFHGRVDFDPGPGTCFLESEEDRNSVYVMSLDPEGNFLWASNFWGGYSTRTVTDASGNLLMAGCFTDSLHINPGETGEVLVAEEEEASIFLLHLDQEGNLISAKKKIVASPGYYYGSRLSIQTSDSERIILSGTLEEDNLYDCINTLGFILEMDTDGSTINEWLLDLEGGGDPFEDNDELDLAASMEDSLLHTGLTISEGDDDWYNLSAFNQTCVHNRTLTISCFFDHSEGDINMELVRGDGTVVATSMSQTDNEQIIYVAGPDELCYLHIHLKPGNSSSYSLRWEDHSILDIPDPKFLEALIETGVDRDGDSLISSYEAQLVQNLKLAGMGISDMTGIGCFPYLDSLDCSANQLSSLDLRDCQHLKTLICDNNQLDYLNVSDCRELVKLSCHHNQLSYLLVTNNEKLDYLDCSQNQLESLHLIYNYKLSYLDASGNLFEQLNLVLNRFIGYQPNSGLILSNMPFLKEVCIRELPFPPADFQGILDTTGSPGLSFKLDCRLDSFVYIPDRMFRRALNDEGVDDNQDSLISLEEAQRITILDVSGKEISDLTGIEAFIHLERLYCQNNKLTSLDLSRNSNLSYLLCANNLLDSLDVSHLRYLHSLDCRVNLLDSLLVSAKTDLRYLYCSGNQLHFLDASDNASLQYLECHSNWLSTLDISNCPLLNSIACYSNLLTHLDLSACPEISNLECSNNQLKILDLSRSRQLRSLNCSDNLLSRLDLSNTHELRTLRCEFNQLDSLEIFDFDDLTELRCNNNLLRSLVLSGCPSLEKLECHSNRLSSLDLNACRQLKILQCEQNLLESIDVGMLTRLEEFRCAGNQLRELDVSRNTLLYRLDCSGNQLSSLNLSETIYLDWISLDSMPDLIQVCVWQLPFPPDHVGVTTNGSPDVIFENWCGRYTDLFEDNDRPEEAAYLEINRLHQDLIISEDDEDWYLLSNENYASFNRIIAACWPDSAEGEIQMDLLTLDGVLLASSQRDSTKEVLEYLPVNHSQLLLRVSMNSGSHMSYMLRWNLESYLPHSDLSVCITGANCSLVRIDPENGTSTVILDTLKLNMFSGDRRTESMEITNQGPGPYLFYSALSCTSLPDSLNKAIRFNGTDSYIQVPRNFTLDAPEKMTIEAWIKNKAGSSGSYGIVSKGFSGGGYELYVAGNDQGRRLGFMIAQADIQSSTILEDDRWYHVAATYTNQSIRLYINGMLDKVAHAEGPVLAVNQDLFIGTRLDRSDTESIFPGDVDEVRIWNKVRTDDEIYSYMHRELKGEEDGLIGYWPFTNGTLSVVFDHASGNNGMIIGGAERISSSNAVLGLINWSPGTGLIAVNSSLNYQLEFNAVHLKEGKYITTIEFISSQPHAPDILLPTSLYVTEAPSFSIQPEILNLGEIDIYKTQTNLLTVTNEGTQVLEIDSIRTDLVGSRITPASGTLEPGGSKTFKVEVFPKNLETFFGNLTFYTNDPNGQQVQVPIAGEGSMASKVAILNQIDATLKPESMYLRIMGFENTSSLHGLTLYPSLITYHLPESGSDLMLVEDDPPKTWISTTLPEIGVLPPLGEFIFNLVLESYSLPAGDYYADVVLEWYNPFYQKGYLTVRMHVESPVGMQQESMDPGPLLIYPNPTRGELFIQAAENETVYHISISSINGSVIMDQIRTGNIFSFDLSSYPRGIYVVSVRWNNTIVNRKIILH